MRITRIVTAIGAVAATTLGTMLGVGASQAVAAPDFQMPFECGYTATAATFDDHSPLNSVDFQKGGITGTPVVASAPGTVSVVGNEGADSYGRWIEIDHGGGYTTRYAHLSEQSVGQGDRVSAGSRIGKAGATGGVTGPHLHFEQRLDGTAQRVTLNGVDVPYFGKKDFTSTNGCDGGGGGGPYTPQEVCGSGYSVINSHALGDAGTVYLLYNADNGTNCVATMKERSLDRKTPTATFLEIQGSERVTDSGDFVHYAGPVRGKAADTCVKWGGSVGSESFTSPFEHCG